MKKELTLRWTKTKPLTRQGRGKEEETASVASLFVLFKFKPLSKNGEYYISKQVLKSQYWGLSTGHQLPCHIPF